MNDIDDLVIIPDIGPLHDVKRIKLQFVRLFQRKDDLKQVANFRCAPDKKFVVAFQLWPWRPGMSDDILGFLGTDAMPCDVGQIPIVPGKRQIHRTIV